MEEKELLIIVGESGCGKTTLLKELEKRGYKRIITYTTRPKRKGEKDDIDYHYISEDEFLTLLEKDFFAEHALYRGWRYGTAVKDCMKPNVCVAMTPAGMRALDKQAIKKKSVYIYVDRRSRLMKLLSRGDNIDEAYRRSLSDVGQFDGVENEVDLVIKNTSYNKTPEEIADLIERLIIRGK